MKARAYVTSTCVNSSQTELISLDECAHADLLHRGSVVGVGGCSWQASVMDICWVHVVRMMRVMLGMDVIFLVVISYHLHSALSLRTKKQNKTQR